MRRTFINASIESGMDEEFAKENVEQVLSEKAFIDSIMSCMEQWAGVISARIDESDREEADNGE